MGLLSVFAMTTYYLEYPGGSVIKNPPASAGDADSIHGSGRSPGVGNGYPLQCSCLQNPMDTQAWQATVHEVAKNQTLLSNYTATTKMNVVVLD